MSFKLRIGGAAVLILALSQVFLNSTDVQKLAADKPRLGGTLKVKPFTDVFKPDLDPAGNSYYFILDLLYDGLVRLDNNFNIVPSLAEYWVISQEGRIITFYLRKGVKFHNGREVTATDVKFSLERLVNKNIGALCSQYFTTKVIGAEEFWEGNAADVAGFKVRNRYTFEIEWRNPYVSGLYLLSMYFCKILPKELVQSQRQEFFMKPSGTGAFRFGYWLRNPKLDVVGVRLERNDDYFGELPYLDAVEFSPFFTRDQFKKGFVHIMPLLSEDLASGRYQILENNSLDFFFLGMSCQIPPLDKKEVRQALSLVLNKRRIAQAAYSIESIPQIVNNYIPPDLPGYLPAEEYASKGLETAKQKLAEAGFGQERGFPELVLCFLYPRRELQMRLYKEIRERFETLGIKLDMKYFKSFEEMQKFPLPHLMVIDWLMDFPDAENIILPMFQSQSVLNKMSMNYSNPQLDGLLAASEVEGSWEKRIELFRRMEQILFEDVPAVPLFQLKLRLALQPYVRGAKAPPLSIYFLDVRDIWLDR